MKRHWLFLTGCLSILLVACGGGSGGGDSTNSQPVVSSSSSSSSSNQSSASSSSIPITLQPITRENTPYLASATFDLLEFASGIEDILEQLHNDISLINDGQYSGACDNTGGEYSLKIESSGNKITEIYVDCEMDGDYFSGSRITEIFDQGSNKPKRVIQRWDNLKIYEVSSPQDYEQSSGQIEYVGSIGNSYDNDQQFSIAMNASIESGIEGLLEVQNAQFTLPYGFSSYPAAFSYFQDNQQYSATISWNGVGAANFSYDSTQKTIIFTGSTDAKARVKYDQRIYMSWDDQGDGATDAQSVVVVDIDNGGLSKALLSGSNEIIKTGVHEIFLDGRDVYMARGQTLEVDMRSFLGHTSASLLDYGMTVDGDSNPSDNWQQSEIGKFTLVFPSNISDKTYDLIFYARDTAKKSIYQIAVKFFVGSDYDDDKIPDAYDNDDDSDGYNDDVDDYPLNDSEARDTDEDGIPDNLDADADADGVPNFTDAEPLDSSNCVDASQNICYPYWQSDRSKPWFLDDNGVLYFEIYYSDLNTSKARKYVHRLDTNAGEYLLPLVLPDQINSNVLYLPDLGKIFTYTTKVIYQTNLDSDESSLLIQSSVGFGIRYVEKSHFVIGHQQNASSDSLYVESYDFNGQLISSMPGDDHLRPTIPQRYIDKCDSAITSTVEGHLWMHTNQLGENCNPYSNYVVTDKDISYDKTLIYRSGGDELSDGGIYLTADDSLLTVIPAGHQLYWLPNNNYVIYAENEVNLHSTEGSLLKNFVMDQGEEFIKLLSNNNKLVLVSRVSETGYTNIRLFDETLTLLNTYGY